MAFRDFTIERKLVVVIALTAIVPPEVLGLSTWLVGVIYLGVWGISTMVSPFSGTTLFMSRATGEAAHVIGWRWAPGPAVVAGTVVVIFTVALRHLGFD